MDTPFPVKGFIETSFSDWPGRVTAVLFLPGCNLRCPFCHNHRLVLHPEEFENFPWPEILARLRTLRGWIDGVCLTGGEPTIHPWLPRLVRELKSSPGLTPRGGDPLPVKLDTNGTRPEVLRGLLAEGLVDFVAMDLKSALSPHRFSSATGVARGEEHLSRVQESIQILLEGRVECEFRTTVVPTLIDEEEIYDLARSIRGARRYTLQAFNPREALDENLKKMAPSDPIELRRLQDRVNGILGQKVSGCGFRIAGSGQGTPEVRLQVPGQGG